MEMIAVAKNSWKNELRACSFMREEVEEVAIEVELMRKVSADRHVTYGIDHCRNCHKVSWG